MRGVAALTILLSGCLSDPHRQLDSLYSRARVELQAGEPAKAQATVESALSLVKGRADPVDEWRFRILRSEIRLNSSAAEVLQELRTELPTGPDFTALRARQKMLEGRALVHLDRLDEAGRVLDEALRLASAAQDTETLVDVETLQGSRLGARAEWDAADGWLRRAAQHAQSAHLPLQEAGILVNLGMNQIDRHRYDAAVGYLQRAEAIAKPQATLYSVIQLNLGICYYRLGEFDRAIRMLLESVAQNQRSGEKLYLQRALGAAGNAYLLNGDVRKAADYLERAENVAKEVGRNADAAIWAGNLATLHSELGDWDAAERFNNEAIRIKTASGSRTLVYNTLNAGNIAIGRGQYADGERLYQQAISSSHENPAVLWDAYGALGESAMLQHHPDLACRYFESAVTIVEQTRSDLLSTEYKLPFLTRLIRFYQQYVNALVSQGDYERALAVADSSRAQVLAERFGSTRVRRLSPEALKTIAQQSGSSIVSYWLSPQRSLAWVVSADRIRHFDLPPEPEIAALVTEYSDAVQRRLVDPLRTRIPAAERLFQVLVQPLGEWIPAGSRVAIVPDGVLTGLNFETLPVPGDQAHFWIQDATVTVAPAIGVLNHPTSQAQQGRRLLLIGDPENADPAFPPLTHAADEIDGVLQHFDAAGQLVLRRKDAVPQAYQAADPARFSVIHFTAHAVANRESPLDSAVLLSGGKLYAREVMNRPLVAQLVTFSACRGAGSRTYGGEGLVGFAWAFLRAGARNVIAGLWDVNDQSTANLMEVTYRELESGKAPQEALRIAKLSLIRSPGNLKKPYYWGPFQVYTLAP